MAADYHYDYMHGTSYPNNLPVDSAEGSFIPSTLPPRNGIYSTTLMNLTNKTTNNLEILKAKLIAADPCYAYGPQHWHRDRKWEEYPEFSNDLLENSRSKYDRPGVHFTTKRNIKQLRECDGQQQQQQQQQHVKNREEENLEAELVNPFCYLCTTVDEHQKHIARRGLQFKAKEKIRPRIQFIAPPPTVKRKVEEEEEKAELLYKVSVRTGVQPLAATRANVFFILRGQAGVMKKKPLTKKSSVKFTFGRGTTENFFIKGPRIGKLRTLTLMHDGMEKKDSWYVEEVTVTIVNSGELYVFPCKQWLSLYLGDQQLKRTLEAHVQEMVEQQTEYEVVITTADKFQAGTDANVFLTIYGKKGVSRKFPLRNKSKNNFEAGHDDKFTVTVEKDIGSLTKIRLEHDNTGVGAGWLVEKVKLTDKHIGTSWTFPCGQWLASDEGDRKTARDLFPLPRQHSLHSSSSSLNKGGKRGRTSGSAGPQLMYELSVVTGTKRHAGTDAHVFVTLLGALGKTQDIPLDDGKDHFEKGQTDLFKRKAQDVGDLKRIIIRHDNAGLAAGWYLERMTIRRYFSAQEVKDRLSTMASEMHDHVSNITGEDMPATPTKKRTLKHQRSVSFENLEKAGKKDKKKKHRYEEEEEEEEEESARRKGRKNKFDDDEEEEEVGRKRKDDKKSGKKYRWDEEEEEERGKKKQRHRKKKNLETIDEDKIHTSAKERRKKTYKYQGIEVEATDSETETETETDEEFISKKGKKNKSKSKSKQKTKKCYVDSSSSSDSDSDSDSEPDSRKQYARRKQRDNERTKKNKPVKKTKTKKHVPATSSLSSSSSSSETDEEVYTVWTKGRVPYCDEYVFECNRWFATDEDDGLIQRELRPKSVTTFYKIDD